MCSSTGNTRVDTLKERALQILNLRYLIKSDIEFSYKKRIFKNHPDRHPETKGSIEKFKAYEDRIKLLNQAYELLIDVLNNQQIDQSKYCLLEDTDSVQLLLPENIKPVPLGKTEQELWVEKWGSFF